MRRRPLLIGLIAAAAIAAVVLLVSGGGSDNGGYVVRAVFDNGGFMVKGEQVRVAGANVGTGRDWTLFALKDGHAHMLQCRYHGWTYQLDGMLRGVPRFNRTELFDKKDYGLVPVRLAEWQGLLFVHLESEPAPVAALLAGIGERLTPMRLDRLVFAKRADYEARWEEHRAELAKTRQRSSELELRMLAQRNAYVQSATDELKEITTRLFDLEERLRPSKDAADRQRIAAPIAGVVVGLRVFNAGAVVGPREVLLEIVPEDKTLVVEARIRPEDINHVRKGSEAEVRLTAYKQRTTPLVAGSVNYVSADRMLDPQTGTPYYVVQVDVPARALEEAGNLRMQAGMPAEVYIRTDSRSTFDYLFAPVTAYLRRGMREPL